MRPRLHPQGQCPAPVARLRIVGDRGRATYSLCAACRVIYEAAPFTFTFVPVETPEWQMRALESRLPSKVSAVA